VGTHRRGMRAAPTTAGSRRTRVIDRDIFGGGDYGDFGIAVSGGNVMAFGVSVGASGTTLCSSRDGWRWAVASRCGRAPVGCGAMQLFVDGQPAGSTQGATGDASYRDGPEHQRTPPIPTWCLAPRSTTPAPPTLPSVAGSMRCGSRPPRATPPPSSPPTIRLCHRRLRRRGCITSMRARSGACTGAVLDACGCSPAGRAMACALYGGLHRLALNM
jgi:hypothetical protein